MNARLRAPTTLGTPGFGARSHPQMRRYPIAIANLPGLYQGRCLRFWSPIQEPTQTIPGHPNRRASGLRYPSSKPPLFLRPSNSASKPTSTLPVDEPADPKPFDAPLNAPTIPTIPPMDPTRCVWFFQKVIPVQKAALNPSKAYPPDSEKQVASQMWPGLPNQTTTLGLQPAVKRPKACLPIPGSAIPPPSSRLLEYPEPERGPGFRKKQGPRNLLRTNPPNEGGWPRLRPGQTMVTTEAYPSRGPTNP